MTSGVHSATPPPLPASEDWYEDLDICQGIGPVVFMNLWSQSYIESSAFIEYFSTFQNLTALMYCTQSEDLLSGCPESPGCVGGRGLHVSTAQCPLQVQQQRRLFVVTTGQNSCHNTTCSEKLMEQQKTFECKLWKVAKVPKALFIMVYSKGYLPGTIERKKLQRKWRLKNDKSVCSIHGQKKIKKKTEGE